MLYSGAKETVFTSKNRQPDRNRTILMQSNCLYEYLTWLCQRDIIHETYGVCVNTIICGGVS